MCRRIIAKGAGGGLGSRGVGSSRGALAVSVFELHKDEKIHILVGQRGESACIKSFLNRDDNCESSGDTANSERPSNSNANSKTKQVKDIVIESGTGGGGGGATFIFILNSAEVAVPLMVAAGGGGLGIGHFIEDNQQHGRVYDSARVEVSGQRHGELNITGGAGKQSVLVKWSAFFPFSAIFSRIG